MWDTLLVNVHTNVNFEIAADVNVGLGKSTEKDSRMNMIRNTTNK